MFYDVEKWEVSLMSSTLNKYFFALWIRINLTHVPLLLFVVVYVSVPTVLINVPRVANASSSISFVVFRAVFFVESDSVFKLFFGRYWAVFEREYTFMHSQQWSDPQRCSILWTATFQVLDLKANCARRWYCHAPSLYCSPFRMERSFHLSSEWQQCFRCFSRVCNCSCFYFNIVCKIFWRVLRKFTHSDGNEICYESFSWC